MSNSTLTSDISQSAADVASRGLMQPANVIASLLSPSSAITADPYVLALSDATQILAARRVTEEVPEELAARRKHWKERMNFDGDIQQRGGIVHLKHAEHRRLLVVGDIHGDIDSFRAILRHSRFVERVLAGEDLYLVLVGDYINKGKHSIECLDLLCRLLAVPELKDRVIPLSGNHEDQRYTPHVAKKDLTHKYVDAIQAEGPLGPLSEEKLAAVIRTSSALFNELPIGLLTSGRVGVFHSGGSAKLNRLSKPTARAKLYCWPLEYQTGHELLNSKIVSRRSSGQESKGTEVLLDEMYASMRRLGSTILLRGHEPVPDQSVFPGKDWKKGHWELSKKDHREMRSIITLNSQTNLASLSAAYAEVDLSRERIRREDVTIHDRVHFTRK